MSNEEEKMSGSEKKREGSDWTGLLTGERERRFVGEQAGLLLDLPGEATMRGEALVLCHQIDDPHLVAELAVLLEDLVGRTTAGRLPVVRDPHPPPLHPDLEGKEGHLQDPPHREGPPAVHTEGLVHPDLPAPGCRRSPVWVRRCR